MRCVPTYSAQRRAHRPPWNGIQATVTSGGAVQLPPANVDVPLTRASTMVPTEKETDTASLDTRETEGKTKGAFETPNVPAGGEQVPKQLTTKEIQLVFAA